MSNKTEKKGGGMKKVILFFALAVLIQASYAVVPILAQSSDEVEVRKVVDNYFEGISKGDVNSLMNQISTDYSGHDREGNVLDYAKVRPAMEENLKKFLNISINDLKIANLDIQNNKATLEVEYNFRALNQDTAENMNIKIKRLITLVKENDSWKIVEIEGS